MTTKHTPGPWEVLPGESRKPYLRVRGTCLGRLYKIANVLLGFSTEESKANARLIAAAPELLEALESIRDLPAHPMRKRAVEIATAAIAKATGEQP